MHATAAAPPARPRRGYWLPAIIAMIVLVGIGLAVGAGDLNHSSPKRLSGRDIEQQLALGIESQQGLSRLPMVSCPASEPSVQGHRFTCTLHKSRSQQTVYVVEVNSFGGLQWQLGP